MNEQQVTLSRTNTVPSGVLKECIRKAVDGKFNAATVKEGKYKVDMYYDGYGVSLCACYDDKHFASWDSLRKELIYFRNDQQTLRLVAKFVNAVTGLGYLVEEVKNEFDTTHTFNWRDFVETTAS